MANKYLEKVAIVGGITGYRSSKEGDKLGGTLSGISLDLAAEHALNRRLPASTPNAARLAALVGSGLVGGHYGGKGYSKVKDWVLDRSPEIEKKADTALKRYVNENKLPGSRDGIFNGMGARELNQKYTGLSPTAMISSGGTMTAPKKQFLTGKVIGTQRVPTTDTRQTGDVLASRGDLASRVSTYKANKASTSKPGLPANSNFAGPSKFVSPLGPKPNIPGLAPPPIVAKAAPKAEGLLSRAIGFAKRNPLAAGGIGLAAGGLGLASMSRGQPNQQYQYSTSGY